VTGYTWRRRELPGARAFVLALSGALLWAGAYGVGLLVFDRGLRRAMELLVWLGGGVMPVAWVVFALQYTGRSGLLSRRRVAGLAVPPAVFVGLLSLPETRPLLLSGYRIESTAGAATVAFDLTPVAWAYVGYEYLLLGVGVAVVGELLASRAAYRRRAAILIGVVAASAVTSVAYYLGVGPLPRVDLTPTLFSVAGAVFAYGLFGEEILALSPATRRIGREVALDGLGDPVFVVEDGRIVDTNDAAGRVLSGPPGDCFGRPIEAVLGADLDGGGEGGEEGRPGTVLLDTDRGRREFDVTTAPVESADGRRIGRTVVLHDVSDRVRQRQRIEVLNRALRHNIRNDAGTILGVAELLSDDDRDADAGEFVTEPIATVEAAARDLVAVGRKAREVDQLLSDAGGVERVTVAAVVDDAVTDVTRGGPAVAERDIAVSVAPDLAVHTERAVLRLVLKNLVENALEHGAPTRTDGGQRVDGDPDTSRESAVDAPVRVSARTVRVDGERAVAVTVADDGPGIPEAELSAVEAGSETALRHGSGLGLWVVDWGVRTLGGTVEYDTTAGTTATVRVPDRAAAVDERG
jgi:signal transduction histidine kinase